MSTQDNIKREREIGWRMKKEGQCDNSIRLSVRDENILIVVLLDLGGILKSTQERIGQTLLPSKY